MNQERIKILENKIHKEYSNMAGIVVLHEGNIVYEQYFNDCNRDSRIHIYSVTKSIMSLLFGIAIDKGYIKSLDQKVLEFFPKYVISPKEKTIQNITLRDVLTMTAPYKYNFFPPYIKYFKSDDAVKFTLDLLGGKGKIGKFKYTPLIGPDILSGIIMNATGMSVLDFASTYVFDPLKITVEKSIVFENKEEQMAFNKATDISGWVTDVKGVHTGGWGLTLSARDMAKIGKLYLDGGKWNEKQIVSTNWINESTCQHSYWKKQDLAYGYLWWVHDFGFAAMGDGGNTIYVNTKRKLVVSITSLFARNVKDRIDFIKEYIEPLVDN